ncbi:hypothetical protein NQZ68_003649 [Dissostichus eleginoides]|nr:hypothetical protein NQZ68_003649 [Dissostichus eleginoides]
MLMRRGEARTKIRGQSSHADPDEEAPVDRGTIILCCAQCSARPNFAPPLTRQGLEMKGRTKAVKAKKEAEK